MHPRFTDLSRRERQIMDILYRNGRATASEIHQALPDRPSYSAVRAKLRVLEEKGHIRHEEDGSARLAVRVRGLDGTPQIGLSRHVHDGVVDQHGIEQAAGPAEPKRRHVALDVLALGVQFAAQIQHSFG